MSHSLSIIFTDKNVLDEYYHEDDEDDVVAKIQDIIDRMNLSVKITFSSEYFPYCYVTNYEQRQYLFDFEDKESYNLFKFLLHDIKWL